MTSLVWRQHHYIRNGDGIEELYHLQNDPGEEDNLVSSAAREVLRRLRASLPSEQPS
jgi:hypothetical protein